jgi:hypothetical protein
MTTHHRNWVFTAVACGTILLIAMPLLGGGFWLQLGNPEASPEARQLKAVLTVHAMGCADPARATLEAEAIGFVKGERKTIPLQPAKMSGAGKWAITQQWPSEGRWVLQFTAKADAMLTTALVPADENGVQRTKVKLVHGKATADDIAALLGGKLVSTTR